MDKIKFYDTNAILHNIEDLKQQNMFYVSSTTLKELENIKTSVKKDVDVKYQARKVSRYLRDNIDKYKCVVTQEKHYDLLKKMKLEADNDNLIMACAYLLNKEEGNILFITNDICCFNLSVNIFKMETEENVKKQDGYKGYVEVIMSEDKLAKWYENKNNDWYLLNNEYLIIRDENNNIIDKYKYLQGNFLPINVDKYIYSSFLGDFRPKDIYQLLTLETLQNNQINLIKGKAGSGKSLIAMSYLFHQIEKSKIDKIIIFCNTIATRGSAKLGYYPGARDEKLMDSSIGNFLISKLGDKIAVDRLISEGKLMLLPMSDIRGFDTTGMRCGVYITEAQNTSIDLMRLALQRIGDDSLCIIDGDYTAQVDDLCFAGSNNGMKRLSEIFRGQDFYGEIELNKIYRSKIAALADLM